MRVIPIVVEGGAVVAECSVSPTLMQEGPGLIADICEIISITYSRRLYNSVISYMDACSGYRDTRTRIHWLNLQHFCKVCTRVPAALYRHCHWTTKKNHQTNKYQRTRILVNNLTKVFYTNPQVLLATWMRFQCRYSNEKSIRVRTTYTF